MAYTNELLNLQNYFKTGETKSYAFRLKQLKKLKLNNCFLVGGDFAVVKHPYHFFENVTAAADWLKANLPSNAQLLIKGSRSIKMEKLLDVL